VSCSNELEVKAVDNVPHSTEDTLPAAEATPSVAEDAPPATGASLLRREWPLLVTLITTVLFFVFGKSLLSGLGQPLWFTFILTWLFSVSLLAAFAVVRHAESLAALLGEPLGTLLLTLAVTGVEATIITAAMFTGEGNSALARDAMFAVVMIVLNGMVGLSLLLGGLRYHEQEYNLQGAHAFLSVIVPLAVLGLILPNFTTSSSGPTFSSLQAVFLAVMSLGLYGVFLAIQNLRYSHYFIAPNNNSAAAEQPAHGHELEIQSAKHHTLFLLAYLLPLVYLAKKLAVPFDFAIRVFNAPEALGGFLVAALVLSPESMSATRAALANQLQRSVNILLGSALATIGLTIPAVLTIGLFTGKTIILGLGAANMTLLALTLVLSALTFSSSRTNILLGAVHLLLFLAYLMLIFEG
jgi:Ca2+:H+ antiporter